MQNLTEERTLQILDNLRGKSIAVIGDVMLDRYFWGQVSRISPEAPVPVIDIESETFHLGGAANVANNLKTIGIEPLLCGLIGSDNSGRIFRDISSSYLINISGLYEDESRPTTVKTRVIGNNQQIVRLDRETRNSINSDGINHIKNVLINQDNLSGIIFEDYNKGVITESLIIEVMSFAKEKNIPVFVDPKFDNFFAFKGVTVFKPNRKEAQQALGFQIKNTSDVQKAGYELLRRLECEYVLITLGADGMMLFDTDGCTASVKTRARHVADVSGAGDTAIATLAASIAGGAKIKEAATLANFASGSVCEEPGIVPITKEMLITALRYNNKKAE